MKLSTRLIVIAVAWTSFPIGALDAWSTRGWAAEPTSQATMELSSVQAQQAMQWLADVGRRYIPPTFSGDDDWGNRKRLWSGVHIKRDGWELRTHRKYREVRHGRWVKYDLTLPGDFQAQPNPIQVTSVEPAEDARWRLATTVTAPLSFEIRIERWNLGVQWYSISVQGDMRVRLDCVSTVGLAADYREVPPALELQPKIESARMVLEHFEVERISKVGGDVAEETGEVIEKILREKWLDRENERLSTRLNEAIEKRRDRLRFSLTEWISNWQ